MKETEQCTQLIFIRHGEADFPSDRLYRDEDSDDGGKGDGPGLTAQGESQIAQLSELLKDESIAALYVSPSKRTRLTAYVVSAVTGLTAQTDARLKERHFGVWEGLYFDAIKRDYAEDYLRWKKDMVNFVPEGGESIDMLSVRINNFLNEIIEKHSGEKIVVVTHVGPIRMFISMAMCMPLEAYRQLTINCASLSRIDYGRVQNNLMYLNRGG